MERPPFQNSVLLLLIVPFVLSLSLAIRYNNEARSSSNTNFSQKYFGVNFEPYVNRHDAGPRYSEDRYSVRELVVMISTISSQFRNIFIQPISNGTHKKPGHDIKEIAKAVATWNKDHRAPDQVPLEVLMPFRPDWETNGFGSFELVKALADEANSIFPNTVRTILFSTWDLSRDTLNASLNYLSYALTKINEPSSSSSSEFQFQYKLGASLPFDECGPSRTRLEPYLVPILPLLDLVIFHKNPRPKAFRSGVDPTLKTLTDLMDNCKFKLTSSAVPGFKAQIGFGAVWVSGPKDVFAQPSDIGFFWRGMNEWAERTSTMAILGMAFDNPYRLGGLGHRLATAGWWRLVDDQVSYRDALDYKFETKEEVYLKNQRFSGKHFGVWFDPQVSSSKPGTLASDNYSVDEITIMIKTISSKFGTILMRPIEPNYANYTATSDTLEIPRAIAEFNKNHKSPEQKTPLSLMMQFKWDDHSGWDTTTQPSFNSAKRMADEANFIFAGSVQLLLLHRPKLESASVELLSHLKSRLALEGDDERAADDGYNNFSFRYKLGLTLPLRVCRDKFNLENYLFPILPLLHVILFELDTTMGDFQVGAKTWSRDVRQQFEDCSKGINGYGSRDAGTKLAFSTWWPSRWNGTVKEEEDFANQVVYWKEMYEWAVGYNSSVILYEAFDNPGKRLPFRTTGWWRLVLPKANNATTTTTTNHHQSIISSEEQFEEKEKIALARSRSITPFLSSPSQVGTNFSRQTTGVFLYPSLSKKDNVSNYYSTEELIILISKISSKFSIILMPAVSDELPDAHVLNIPAAVALFNRDYYSPPTEAPEEAVVPPLQLIMQFKLDRHRSLSTSNTTATTGNGFSASFDRVKQLADEANIIYPGTVQLLLLDLQELVETSVEKLDGVMAGLTYAHQKNTNNHKSPAPPDMTISFKYQIGIVAAGELVWASNFITYLLKNKVPSSSSAFLVDYIMLEYFPSFEDFQGGAVRFAQKLVADFEAFKSKMAAVFSPEEVMELGILSGWPTTWLEDSSSSSTSGQTSLSALVDFWKEIDDYGGGSNTTVILSKAFDNPNRETPGKRFGWWQLVDNNDSSYRHAGDYVFESKEDVLNLLLEEQQRKIDRDEDEAVSKMESLTVILLVVGTGMLLLIVGGPTALLLHKRVVRKQQERIYTLTKREIQGFFDGGGLEDLSTQPGTSGGIIKIPNNRAYDQRLEIPSGSFEIDDQDVLGSGAFGQVFRGTLRVRNVAFQVAVKTTKPTSPASALRGLLSEIKIMSYVGNHEYILGIAGAHTAELQAGRVFVFTEFCALGSLNKFLQEIDRSKSLQATFISNSSASTSLSAEEGGGLVAAQITTPGMCSVAYSDLEKWSTQIICGMEYLASKHVVHADLATRNVLLTAARTAKIADFGLSRKLYNYEDYVKSQKEPIPWRWNSPESLRLLVFNEKTDVWSFGITLWEIFSLGDLPYPGMSWDVSWVDRLDEGLRLGPPKYDQKNKYSIMKKCWEADPTARPSFSNLKALWDEMDYVAVL